MRINELTLARSLLAPFLQPASVPVEERYAAVYIAVRNIEGPVRTDSNVCGLVEVRRVPCSNAWFPKRENHLAIVCELENLLQRDVGQENIVLPIDGDAVRNKKHVRAPRRNELTCIAVDLDHCRFAELRFCGKVETSSGSVEQKHVPIYVDCNASDFAELNARRRTQPVSYLF